MLCRHTISPLMKVQYTKKGFNNWEDNLLNAPTSPKRRRTQLTRRKITRPPTSARHQGIRSDRPSAIDFWTESEYILDASRPEYISRAAHERLLHILPRRPQTRLIVLLLKTRSSTRAVILEGCFVAAVGQQCSCSSPTPGRVIYRIFFFFFLKLSVFFLLSLVVSWLLMPLVTFSHYFLCYFKRDCMRWFSASFSWFHLLLLPSLCHLFFFLMLLTLSSSFPSSLSLTFFLSPHLSISRPFFLSYLSFLPSLLLILPSLSSLHFSSSISLSLLYHNHFYLLCCPSHSPKAPHFPCKRWGSKYVTKNNK